MIVFNEEKHEYSINGKVIPSVTTIIKVVLGDKYIGISDKVLKQASEYGTKIHKLIEQYDNLDDVNLDELDMYERNAIKQYFKIKDFEVLEKEKILAYKELYCGTCDGIGKNIIYDIKTTSKVDKKYVSLQLSLYLLAYDEPNYDKYKGFCLWLPKKGRGKKIEIDLYTREELDKVIALVELLF